MPAERLSMRNIKEILRLKWACGLSDRKISMTCAVSRPTVADYVRRATTAGLSWPLPEEVDDARLESMLFLLPLKVPEASRPLPDWSVVHQELTRKGVTLFLLWEEYQAGDLSCYQYSWFCQQYRAWAHRVDLPLRQVHRAGEKLFVDYAGQTVGVVNPHSGEVRQAQIFVAVLGASNYTYAEATWSQQIPDWISSHMRAFSYMEGVPEIVVPDNLKSAVTKAHRYEPDLNPSYQEMARHYGVAVVPARPYKPRDKAKAEAGVLLVERWILARLRHQTFFSLSELNQAIQSLLKLLNNRPFKKLPGSRQSMFTQLDQPALRPLPVIPHEVAEWKKVRVHIDYHVEVCGHYYSVPYPYVRQTLEARITPNLIEVLYQGKRIASHLRSMLEGRHTTVREHMPRAHQKHLDWTPERLVGWATKTGPATAKVVDTIMTSRPHPQHGFRPCLGIMRLGKHYGDERLEAACRRAVALSACGYKSIESILKKGLDSAPLPSSVTQTLTLEHDNIRGPEYYH